ncbi:MAG TPA: ubiquitin-like small modifier protein 1 [Thermomicrobiales bacterium]
MSENGSIRVIIPTPLRRFTDGQAQVNATGATVAEVLSDLDARFPGLKERICEPNGEIRRFVNVFVNGENVRKAQGAATPLKPGDEIGIIPAMAGGSH